MKKKSEKDATSHCFAETETQTQITLDDVGGGRDHKVPDELSEEEVIEGTVLVNPDVNSMDSRG